MIRYTLPIVSQNEQEILDTILREQNNFELFEVWLDYLPNLESDFLEELNRKYADRVIVLFRRLELEKPKISKQHRFALLSKLLELSVLVDLDLNDQAEELEEFGQALGQRLILSFHDYEKTPDDGELKALVTRMMQFGQATIKISCFCQSYRDAFRLLELNLKLNEAVRPHVVLGMGLFGRITRVVGPLIGSSLAYAPLDPSKASATGQLPYRELKSILEQLKE